MTDPTSPTSASLNAPYFAALREHYDGAEDLPPTSKTYRDMLAYYFNQILTDSGSVFEIGTGSGYLLGKLRGTKKAGCDLSPRQVARTNLRLPEARVECVPGEELPASGPYDFLVLADTVNESADVQELLLRLHQLAHPGTRLVISYMNSLWRPLLSFTRTLGLRVAPPEQNWLSPDDVRDLLELSDWELITSEPKILFPLKIPVLSDLLNRFVAPVLPWFCLTHICCARPRRQQPFSPSVSVVIPARNEAGNIAAAIQRMPKMGPELEIIFVEGGSTDDTWEQIQKVQQNHPEWNIKACKQTGKGKGDAVRLGFSQAEGQVLMILDADLTMPPEDLPKFYHAIAEGKAEFANGVRLVYPMEGKAMRFLNLCANRFFAVAFSWLLGQSVKDTLCGTKVLTREAYERLAANRSYFGDFDPFGDFDLLFGAAKMKLRIRDIPIRYRDRTYGETNINRWRDGSLLFRMLFLAAMKLKFL